MYDVCIEGHVFKTTFNLITADFYDLSYDSLSFPLFQSKWVGYSVLIQIKDSLGKLAWLKVDENIVIFSLIFKYLSKLPF